MKKITAFIISVLCLACLAVPESVFADAAVSGAYNWQDAGYYVVVDAWDGYVNFRSGPGLEYGVISPIYNGEYLYVKQTAENYYDDFTWGQVEWNGYTGWVSLHECTYTADPNTSSNGNDGSTSSNVYNQQNAGYYVIVDAWDGYVNFRSGPGTEYGIISPIYNGEYLYISQTADNYNDGFTWGQIDWNGSTGWVSLHECSRVDNPYAASANETTTSADETDKADCIYGQHGTAKFIGGRTLVVSIFADDARTSWNFPIQGETKELYDRIHSQMGTGLDWLEDRTADYGVTSEYIWDYETADSSHPLSYVVSFKSDLTDMDGSDGYREVCDYVKNNIDTADLLNYYNAEDLIIAVHLNAPNSEDFRSHVFTANSTDVDDSSVYYEVIFFTPYGNNRTNTPAVYAHEVLHCFGAADLYYANDFVPQAYVDYLDSVGHTDLMNSCYFSSMDTVTCVFSDVDAWFVGLINSCETADKYGLGPTIFLRWGPYDS